MSHDQRQKPDLGKLEFKYFINDYFNEEDDKSEAISEINYPNYPNSPAISEIDRKGSDSGQSKTYGSLSESTKVPGSGFNGRQEFKVLESFLTNTFVNLSPFSDELGRKLIFEVDWDYLNRKWDITHSHLKDDFFELLFAMGLQDEVINPDEDELRNNNTAIQIEDNITKILEKSNILPYILQKNFPDDENQNSELGDNFFCNSEAQMNFDDQPDIGWSKRKMFLSFMKIKNKYE